MKNPPKENPTFDEQISALLAKALEPCMVLLENDVKEKLTEVRVQYDFSGRRMTRAEQNLGPSDPPRIDTGQLNFWVEHDSAPSENGAIGHVYSSRPETPDVPALLEFEYAEYMAPSAIEFSGKFGSLFHAELAKILK